MSTQVFDPPFAASLDHQVRNLSPEPPVVNDQAARRPLPSSEMAGTVSW